MNASSRRQFLTAGGALIVSAVLPRSRAFSKGGNAASAPDYAPGMLVENAQAAFSPNAYVRIASTGDITLILPNVEMGQGIYTGTTVLIAEELDVEPAKIIMEAAPPDEVYISKSLGTQATGGSTSTEDEWESMRKAGATARMMLVQAAANRWKCPPEACTTADGVIHHAETGRTLSYGDVADEASRLTPPKDVALRPPSAWKLIGKSRHRLDSPVKVTGQALFGIDIMVPGMKFGTVAACPVYGGKLRSMDRDAAMAVRGVRDVLQLENAVCVVGDHYWAVHQGLLALAPVWDEGTNASVVTNTVYDDLHKGLSEPKPIVADKKGDAEAAIAKAAGRYEAVYQQPLLAHSPMEPINCTVHVRPDGADIWVGTQVPLWARDSVAQITGLPKEKVQLHSQYIGGGFGRRLEHEYVDQTAQFAKQVAYPLKIVWSREEDLTLDRYRPAYVDQVVAGLDTHGRITGIEYRVVGPAVVARWEPAGLEPNGFDSDLASAIVLTPYTYPASRLDFVRREAPGVVTAWWRGVGGTRGLFVVESFIDELAAKAGVDPIAYRRELIKDHPRARAVLDLVTEKSGWGSSLPAGHGRGVSVQFLFGSYLATVVEVDMSAPGTIRVVRVTVAADCGCIVNPDQVISQMEGGMIFGLGTALFNEITLKDGRVQQHNFHQWRLMRMNEAPKIEVHLISNNESPGGVGETGTAAAAPALANAVAAASGRRLRTLPLLASLRAGEDK